MSRVLVANRGEIAVRVIRACQALGLESVVAVSDADRDTLAARMATRAVCIGPARPAESYLKVEAIIAAALGTRCDAVHPGYGFLAEHPGIVEACEKHGLTFIGPRLESVREMGNKLLARKIAASHGIPVVPGSQKVQALDGALRAAEELGFPILIKAAGGGGGRGMKIVSDPGDLRHALETGAAEARIAFGDEALYIERYVANARHIEVQVLGDKFGNVVHLGERDCSLQRRYQKVIEESPAYSITQALRERICETAATLARKMEYENAGTVEFLVDQDTGAFYFLEMNTRIQVEHPVTEMVTGIDLVKEQIRVADGRRLGFTQGEVRFSGHAIECRINAESARHGFRPSPGPMIEWSPPEGPGVRVDTHCFPGYLVPPFYDSLLAKLLTHGASRQEAVERMHQALATFRVTGVETNIPFLRYLLNQRGYETGDVNTRWLEAQAEAFLTR
ncbi:MAG: acetyl-CoA carboxylase biotin carboxylase subunit [Deltaproteobacteria bacterium]|nr:acetyl-CoA carboxylase biotin carboxylase subunit [Deltaproteobacteria bacterium]